MERVSHPQFDIRELAVGDLEAFRRLQADSWLATYPDEQEGVTYAWVQELTRSWLTPEALAKSRIRVEEISEDAGQYLRIAFDGGRLVGMIHVLTNDDGTKHLKALYIESDYYGTGLAQKLMRLADEWIDGVAVDLDVARYNARAIRFYEKHNFELLPNTEHTFMDVVPVVKMHRKGAK